MTKRICSFIFIIFFCGCSTLTNWTQIKKEEYKDRSRGFVAVIPEGWTRYNRAKFFIMTKDGIVLNSIVVERHMVGGRLEHTKKKFDEDMLPQDLAEIEIDNFNANGKVGNFKIINNEPVTINGFEGFTVEYTYSLQGGLLMHGVHFGFMYKKWVYRIHYEAAQQHYFRESLGDFKRFMDSFRVIKS